MSSSQSSMSTASCSVSPGKTSPSNRVSVANAATGRPRKFTWLIASHAASWPTASATRQGGKARTPPGTQNEPCALEPATNSVMRSTNENAAKCAVMRASRGRSSEPQGPGPARSGCGRRFALSTHHQLAERLGSEQAGNVRDLHRRLEAFGGNFRQIRPKLRHALFGDDALLLELGFGKIAARILHDLAAWNLDLERALEPEHHVQKIDRFRVEALDQRYVELDVRDVATERVGHRLGDLGVDRHDLFFGEFRLRHAVHSVRYSTHYSILKPPSTPMT